MTLLDAAKELKYFIDTMPPGKCFCFATNCDARETEGYKTAALVIKRAEAKVAAENADTTKSP